MSYAEILTAARDTGLDIFGAFHPEPADGAPPGTGTLILLGPREPGFWASLQASPEMRDGAPDPVDRWSARVIGALAEGLGAMPLYPFGGPPYLPFFRWAERSGRAWPSPVRLLVHDVAGLFVSYRGALAVAGHLALPAAPAAAPCESCTGRPCLTACPAGALTGAGYALDACHSYLDTPAGGDCMTSGCAARRSCPVSQSYGRLAEQSAYHMAAFHKG